MTKKICIILVALLSTIAAHSQTLYAKAFGSPANPPLVYLHGGPGYNSVVFEVTTAERLADSGFYVIVYDRRGEGRSTDFSASYNFEESFNDLDSIYQMFSLQSATLIGHSFGGILATLYAKEKPTKVNSIVLVSAPIVLQETFLTIIDSSKSIYTANKDSVNLNYIQMLGKMDKGSLTYSSYCFGHAMQNGFYTPKIPTAEALGIYAKFRTDSMLIDYGSEMTFAAPKGFWENEKYTTLNLNKQIKKIIKYDIPIFGLYGKEDGLFSKDQVADLTSQIGENNMQYLSNCSHNLFVDQQSLFIDALKKWIK